MYIYILSINLFVLLYFPAGEVGRWCSFLPPHPIPNYILIYSVCHHIFPDPPIRTQNRPQVNTDFNRKIVHFSIHTF